MRAEQAGKAMSTLRTVLDPWLGEPRWKQSEGRITFSYRFASEGAPPLKMRLKVEINSREHFAVHGFVRRPFRVQSRWFSGGCTIPTYGLDELLGTKLRALYQRKKGRDLFDLTTTLHGGADPARVVEAFSTYMRHGGHQVTRTDFEENLEDKLADPQFTADIGALLAPGHVWDIHAAAKAVREALLIHLPG
ncbi:MAG: nucleotidyl transferase AbiEii/AbiGii toxin family protein [Alphaproteobacteria bacterium]|nr:nucleotidyl transferase AbiEii/AbiGii toxin family protein [Alphaproteobacteria bacterium]MDE2112748.1 nucleotidyl transferase AbiEii/AbiGii toxin family protein [Alphaproteobacteria bacterium]MDE2495717.1 nucleotidyl transferase AbiEii/AbiGii toxin family protein [Alphaproteobacteria bacterium]